MAKTAVTATTVDSSPLIPPAISYKLSDRYFLDCGWTTKPNLSLAVPVVVMKAKFSHSIISPWFKERPQRFQLKYPNGKVLCSVRRDGTGQIFYPNGKLAIEVEKGGINNYRTRVWVYSSGEIESDGKKHPPQLCGLFDSLGNGVAYDCFMNKRLVYNQKAGVLFDSPVGVPIAWRWHDFTFSGSYSIMNDEDEVHKLLSDTPHPVMSNSMQGARSTDKGLAKSTTKTPSASPSALSTKLTKSEIDFRENFERDRYLNTERLRPKRVSPMKPVVMRFNKYMSLRILSQSSISLRFIASSHQTTLNIGVLYNPYDKLKVVEIQDPSALLEAVLCPFESFPPKTASMLKFKMVVQNIRKSYAKP